MEAHSIYANFSLDRFSVLLLIGFRCLDFTFALHQLRPAAAFMECVDFTLLKPRCAIVLDKQTAGLIMESRYATFTTALTGWTPTFKYLFRRLIFCSSVFPSRGP